MATTLTGPSGLEGIQLSRLEGWGNTFLVLLVPEPCFNIARVEPHGRIATGERLGPGWYSPQDVLVPEPYLDIAGTPFAHSEDRAWLAKRWCSGIASESGGGADGLIFGLYREDTDGFVLLGDPRQPEDACMVLHNADGSPAEMSGNGLRCLAHALALRAGDSGLDRGGLVTSRASGEFSRFLRFRTAAGARIVELLLTGRDVAGRASHKSARVPSELVSRAMMGKVTSGPELTTRQVQLAQNALGSLRFRTRSVGNPHFVIEVPAKDREGTSTVNREVLRHLGPALARADEPEHAINVELISTDPAAVDVRIEGAHGDTPDPSLSERNKIFMLVWERGVGLTQACGTGAVAAARQAADWGLVDDSEPIAVQMSPQGVATVSFADDRAWLEGPTKRLPLGLPEFEDDLRRVLRLP